jgi:hypothetical protein
LFPHIFAAVVALRTAGALVAFTIVLPIPVFAITSLRVLLALLLIGASLAPVSLVAQVIRGTARSADTESPLPRARIMALSLDGRSIGETYSGDDGRFLLKVNARREPFAISVMRIGMKPTLSGMLDLGPRDTLDVDFSVAEEAVRTDTVRVSAAPGLNEIRLREAERRGWKVFHPKDVASIRDRVMSFEDMLRSTGYPGLIISPRREDCIRTTRTNRCLLIVLDGQPLGGSYPNINPRDVYFMALLTPNQAMLQFGDRGPNGALMIHTRAYGDKINFDKDPPPLL